MNGLIVFAGKPCNLGDYMQSLAGSLFFEQIDKFIEREEVSHVSANEAIYTIMNAWWMWSKKWPPSSLIRPLYISVHIAPSAAEWMLNEAGVEHFRKYAPVGCRDLNTLKMLQDRGI